MAARATASGDVQVFIPPLELVKTIVTIQRHPDSGGLLTNRMSEYAQSQLIGYGEGGVKAPKRNIHASKTWMELAHTIDEEQKVYGFPGDAIWKSLIHAGGRFAGAKMTHLRGMFQIPRKPLEIRGSEPEMHYSIVRQQGTPKPCYRPLFREWEIDVPVTYLPSLISPEQLISLFQWAGQGIGIGAWRPESSGDYGMFVVKGE